MSIDLTTVEGCYAKILIENTEQINAWYESKSVTLFDYKNNVLKLIEGAKFNKVAKPTFIKNLSRAKTKFEVLSLCYNSIQMAAGNGVIRLK